MSPRDCCDRTVLVCVICHARGDYRIGVHLAEQISLVRGAYARTDEDHRQHHWWVERLQLECGCRAWRVVSTGTAAHYLVTERCPQRCDRASRSWLSRYVVAVEYQPEGGLCADYRDRDFFE